MKHESQTLAAVVMCIKVSIGTFYQPIDWATGLDQPWLKPIKVPATVALPSKFPFTCTRALSIWSGSKLVLGTNPGKTIYSLSAEINHEH